MTQPRRNHTSEAQLLAEIDQFEREHLATQTSEQIRRTITYTYDKHPNNREALEAELNRRGDPLPDYDAIGKAKHRATAIKSLESTHPDDRRGGYNERKRTEDDE